MKCAWTTCPLPATRHVKSKLDGRDDLMIDIAFCGNHADKTTARWRALDDMLDGKHSIHIEELGTPPELYSCANFRCYEPAVARIVSFLNDPDDPRFKDYSKRGTDVPYCQEHLDQQLMAGKLLKQLLPDLDFTVTSAPLIDGITKNKVIPHPEVQDHHAR